MSPADIAAEALRIDVEQVSSVDIIRDGLTNDSWLVRTRDDAVVVRVSNPHVLSLQVDREVEARILSVVDTANIGPQVLLCDIGRRLLVTRYLGPTCSLESMHTPDRIAELGALLRRLHALPTKEGIARVEWSAVIADYVVTLATMNRDEGLDTDGTHSRALMLATELEQSQEPPCLCHNDIHYLNLIEANGLRLIDWEYAGLGDRYFDLASAAYYNDFSSDERLMLLRAYSGTVDAKAIERLAKACFVFGYVHDLWRAVRRGVDATG